MARPIKFDRNQALRIENAAFIRSARATMRKPSIFASIFAIFA